MIIFSSVWFLSKKIIKPNFFKKKTETDSNRPILVRFFRTKPVQTGLARFSRFWLGFFRFGSVFSVWFGFFAYKTETEPNRPVFSKF
jgi:hypothetical protein